jgi:hypothetical protein
MTTPDLQDRPAGRHGRDLFDHAGLFPDTDSYWDAEQPHPDSLRLAAHVERFLSERGPADTPDLIDLANALEHGFYRLRARVLAGQPLTLQCLTFIAGRRAEAAPSATVAGLRDEVLSGYAALAALCESLALTVPESVRAHLEVRAGQLRQEALSLLLVLAEARVVGPVEATLADDLAAAYASLSALHALAARTRRQEGDSVGAAYHELRARLLERDARTAAGGAA